MLTKNDLQAIKQVVKNEVDESIEKKVEPLLQKELSPIKNDVEDIKDDIKTIKKEIKPIKSMHRDIRKINKNVNAMLAMLNRDDMRLQKRVKKIEDHLGFPPQQN